MKNNLNRISTPFLALIFCLVFSSAADARKIPNDDESLGNVINEFSDLLFRLDRITKQRYRLSFSDLSEKYDDIFIVGREYLHHRTYKFSFENSDYADYRIKIYGIKRTYPFLRFMQCETWLEYNSKQSYNAQTVYRRVGDWALMEECDD